MDHKPPTSVGDRQSGSVTVASGDISLLEFLWVRHHGISNAGNALPAAQGLHAERRPADPGTATAWDREWRACLVHARLIREIDPHAISLHPEIWEAPRPVELARRVGVSLDDVGVWRESLTVSTDAEEQVSDEIVTSHRVGLRVLLELPLAGVYWERLSSATLVVSSFTRNNQESYAMALRSFADSATR